MPCAIAQSPMRKKLSLEKLVAIQREIALLDRRIVSVKQQIEREGSDSTPKSSPPIAMQLGSPPPSGPFPNSLPPPSPIREALVVGRGMTTAGSLHFDEIEDDESLQAMLAVEMCQLTAAGDTVSLRALLESGANPNCTDYDNSTPLHIAAERGHLDVVKLLLAFKATRTNVDDEGKTPSMIAAERGYDDIHDILMFQDVTVVHNEPDSFLCASIPAQMASGMNVLEAQVAEDQPSLMSGNMIVIMVGLPGRGKTYIAQHIIRYFMWNHYKCQRFTHQSYRKRATGTAASFPTHVPDAERLTSTLLATEINDYFSTGGNIALVDGTHSTPLRRHTLRQILLENTGLPTTRIIFVEVFSNDHALIMSNVLLAKESTRDPSATFVEDYMENMRQHEEVYKTLTSTSDADMSFIRIENQMTYNLNRIDGWLQSRLAYMLHNLRHYPQPIYLTRAGEYEDLVSGRVGGNSRLSRQGDAYSKALFEFMKSEMNGQQFVVMSSCAARCTQTVRHFVHAALRNREVVQEPPAPAHLPPPPLSQAHGSSESISSTGSHSQTPNQTPTVPSAICEANCRVAYFPTLDDLNHGDCEGQLWSDIEATLPNTMSSMRADPYHVAWPNGESVDQLYTGRLEPHIHEIQASTQPILVVSHTPLIQGFFAYFGTKKEGGIIAPEEAHTIAIPLHSVIRIRAKTVEFIDLSARVLEIAEEMALQSPRSASRKRVSFGGSGQRGEEVRSHRGSEVYGE
jgi:broad specificity phosphatase PhoE